MSKSLKLFGGTALGTLAVLTMAVNFADRNIAGFPDNPAVMTAIAPPEPANSGLLVSTANASTDGSEGKFGLGRPALPEEIAAWDLDVSPDGTGLPVGSGSVADGEMIFSENCAVCHGEFAEGVGNWPELAGGEGTLADEDPVKTVGSYWPYLSTAWDYVHRSMPYGNAQTLSNDDVYAIVAYILYSNFLVDDDFVLTNENFLDVEMPNADGFIIDDRAETEYSIWRTEPCMENCKDSVEITMRATVLDVTPDEEASTEAEEMIEAAAAVTETDAQPEAEAVAEAAEESASDAVDPALVAAGEKVFGKCKACHQVGDGAKNRSGPVLNGVVGADIASVDGFKYSKTLAEMEGDWTPEALAAFLANPRGYAKGTKMSFAGLKKEEDIAAVTAYLSTFE
ncbi:c-type cytochrome [Marivita sp. XM-24bin2]|jgi:cytochrome c|uniref:c-type cytochrome n=1 Tax=unclassified Marivita TaxID=2632480 RepID=UPI000D796BFE|nr:c-type cytochrome [Marivita sp. XM-24bin2]MCR9109406.1 c-type cytochrome [Paracoccaceae bacterium]PWL35424.1 MAG: MFS transporter [Marivita sp. XM-24bin2]